MRMESPITTIILMLVTSSVFLRMILIPSFGYNVNYQAEHQLGKNFPASNNYGWNCNQHSECEEAKFKHRSNPYVLDKGKIQTHLQVSRTPPYSGTGDIYSAQGFLEY